MWEKYFLSKRSRYIFGQSYGKLTSKGVGVNKRAQPNIFSSSTCESFHSLAFQQSNATACRENESKSSFFWQTLRSLSLGKLSPQKVGNCLNKESILVRHGCWHFVLVNRQLTMDAYHYNRKLQPRGRSWILMKSSQADSQLRNQSQVINIFLRTKWTNMIKDSTRDETFTLGTCYDPMQCVEWAFNYLWRSYE